LEICKVIKHLGVVVMVHLRDLAILLQQRVLVQHQQDLSKGQHHLQQQDRQGVGILVV
jgi:hypothetical protein